MQATRPPLHEQHLDLAQTFASVALALSEPPELPVTTQRIVESAVKLIGCPWAEVSHLRDGKRLVLDAGTDPEVLGTLTDIVERTGQGVALQAHLDRKACHSADLAQETRWREYVAEVLAKTPIRSIVAYFLELDDQDLGVLTLYAPTGGFFTDEICQLASIYADHAAIALAFATEHSRAGNLQTALQSNREIGIALGILMAKYGMTERDAFDLLRTVSQHTQLKLRDIASELVMTGQLVNWEVSGLVTHRMNGSASTQP
jgi:transcriptional regulator with GAF, ATPase, and Fis domain